MKAIKHYLSMIKIEHTLFAMPFALAAMVLAAGGMPQIRTIFWIVFCMVFARSGAMGFNRWADALIDAKNPRTAGREIPAGRISGNAALAFVLVSFALFIFGTYQMNKLSFMLSPIPIAVFVLYSYTKRFTSLCHFVLGVALGMAPIGAWIATQGTFDARILYLSVGVLVWCAGFDLLYALQDMEFDAGEGLYSIPSRLGVFKTVLMARSLHLMAFTLFFMNGVAFNLHFAYLTGLLVSGVVLVYEHVIIVKHGLNKLDKAFFNMNAIVSIILFLSIVIDVAIY